jgi:serine/threonine protein kinase
LLDVYSIGLVLFEIFERKLPEFEPSVGVKLPALFMSASVVLPCLSRDPTQRPSASDVVKIVDKLIKSMLLSINDLLQPSGI